MRLISDRQSSERIEFSLFAFGEAILAVVLWYGSAVYLRTPWPILIPTTVTLFLLARTPMSTELGLKWYDRLERWANTFVDYRGAPIRIGVREALLVIVCMLGLPLAAVVIRVLTTAWCMCRYPKQSFKQIPNNWVRVTLATDMWTAPEIVPGFEDFRRGKQKRFLDARISDFSTMGEKALFPGSQPISPFFLFIAKLVVAVPFKFFLYFIIAIYRLSIKSSSVVYLPLIHVAGGFDKTSDLRIVLLKFKESTLEADKRKYSWFVILVLTLLPLALYQERSTLLQWYETEFSMDYRVPGILIPAFEWHLWNITRTLSAFVTIALGYFVAAAYQNIELGEPWPSTATWSTFNVLKILRLLLSVYTIISSVIVLNSVFEWPPVKKEWLPFPI